MRYSDLLRKILNHNSEIQWNYYSSYRETTNVLGSKFSRELIEDYFVRGEKNLSIIVSPNDAENFINNYFSSGGKATALSFSRCNDYQLPGIRAEHTVSTFFLGLIIENCLNGNNTLSITGDRDYPFSYIWFLTALYHDYGYCVTERDNPHITLLNVAPMPSWFPQKRESTIPIRECSAINSMKSELEINLSPFSGRTAFQRRDPNHLHLEVASIKELDRVAKNSRQHLCFSCCTPLRIPSQRYNTSTFIRYYNYRINCPDKANDKGHADHGIVGGHLFYDRMLKNYLMAYTMESRNRKCNSNDFYHNDRHFFVEQLPIFLYIARCIASHNIWQQQIHNRGEYEQYQLVELLRENFKKIDYYDDPLLYILSVADTIEPIKTYKELPPVQAADAIDIEYYPGIHRLIVSSLNNNVPIERLKKKAKGMEDWIKIQYSSLGDNQFALYF